MPTQRDAAEWWVVRYAYDPMGRRITTTSTNGVRRVQTYGLDPNAVAEHTGGDPHTRYTFGLGYDTPLAMSTASSTAFFEQDALSSVTSLTNTMGAVTGRTSYDTYGQITSQTGQASPYTYTGREHEPATGLYHYRARWYDPATGTFTSEDPVPAANLYGYAFGAPSVWRDSTGRNPLGETTAAQIAWGALTGAGLGGVSSVIGYGIRCRNNLSWQGAQSALLAGAAKGALMGAVASAAYAAQLIVPRVLEATSIGWKLLAGAGAGVASGLTGALFDAATGTLDASDDPSIWKLVEAATVVAKVGGDRVENATGTVGGTASEGQGAC